MQTCKLILYFKGANSQANLQSLSNQKNQLTLNWTWRLGSGFFFIRWKLLACQWVRQNQANSPLAGINIFINYSFRKNNTNSQTMINMHSFSIQDKTVTFQYENATLHVSISQRSLINTPVLRSENTLFKSNKFVFDGHV